MFYAAQNTHRDSQNWIEKRRGREEIEVIWGRKRRVKKGERVIKPVITLLSKKWVLKAGFLNVQN